MQRVTVMMIEVYGGDISVAQKSIEQGGSKITLMCNANVKYSITTKDAVEKQEQQHTKKRSAPDHEEQKKVRDPNMPKRPANGWVRFRVAAYKQFKADALNMTPEESKAKVKEMWSALSEDEQNEWNKLQEAEMPEYKKNLAAYKAEHKIVDEFLDGDDSDGSQPKKKKAKKVRDPNQPKKPATGYIRFRNDMCAQLKPDPTSDTQVQPAFATHPERVREATRIWNTEMTEEEKKEWDPTEDDVIKYEEIMTAFKDTKKENVTDEELAEYKKLLAAYESTKHDEDVDSVMA